MEGIVKINNKRSWWIQSIPTDRHLFDSYSQLDIWGAERIRPIGIIFSLGEVSLGSFAARSFSYRKPRIENAIVQYL